MATTVRDLIRSSLRLIGTYAAGETPQASEEQDALSVLNELIDTWSAHNLLIYEVKRSLYPTVAGQQSYDWGPTGDWITTSTNQVGSLSCMQSSNLEVKMVEYSLGDWQDQTVKSTSSTLPTNYYVEQAWPDRSISLWPIPATAGQVALYYRNSIGEFASLDDAVVLPNGYRQAIRFNLALLLAPEYGKGVDPVVAETARSTLAAIKRMNNGFEFMRSDFGIPTTGGTFNIYSGY